MSARHILHLSPEYPPQKVFGLGRFVRDLAVAQARRGDRVTVVTNSIGGSEFDVERRGVHVCRVAFPPPPKPPLSNGQVLQFNTMALDRALEAAEGEEWDLTNVHDWYLVPAGRVLNRHMDLPVVFTVHDTVVGKRFGRLDNATKFVGNAEVWGCQVAEAVICCSQHMKAEITEKYGAPEEEVHVVPCGVDEETFQAAHLEHLDVFRSIFARPADRIVLYVGRLDEEKGIDTLLEAMPKVLRAESRARFVVVGTGEMEEGVRSFVDRQGLEEKVFLTGYAGNAPLTFLYRCADVQVCPSLYEPFGMVALEGMVNGLPIVVSDDTALAEIVEHGRDGMQFRTGSSDALARAVLRLLEDGPLRREMARAARKKARTRYNWDAIADQTDAVYAQTLAQGE
jgi:glycosyltransferase involved in cell wall biosynthesis